MHQVEVAGVFVERAVVVATMGLMLIGAACGAGLVWWRTSRATPWRLAWCVLGACVSAPAALLAAYACVVAIYVMLALAPV